MNMTNRTFFPWLGVLSAMLVTVTTAQENEAEIRARLLHGVHAITAEVGVPGPLCVFGPKAVPIVLGKGQHVMAPVVAAGRLGTGRVVAFGHSGYLNAEAMTRADTGRLMANAVRWVAGRNDKLRVGVYLRRGDAFVRYLTGNGFDTLVLRGRDWTRKLAGLDAVCLCPARLSPPDARKVTRFIRRGHGLVAADLGWGWLQLHPGQTIRDHRGSRLLAEAGIVWADGTLRPTRGKTFAAGGGVEFAHAARALEALLAHRAGKRKLDRKALASATATLVTAVRTVPQDDRTFLAPLRSLRRDRDLTERLTFRKPLRPEHALARVLLALELDRLPSLPVHQVRAHPSAAVFPGVVPDSAPRATRRVMIDPGIPGWHSTGLYAPPGSRLEVSIPENATALGFALRIGAHKDRLWHKPTWKRAPEISLQRPLIESHTQVASAFGGLVYVDVPRARNGDPIPVRIAGVVEAPCYRLGSTDTAAWQEQIRHRAAPWAELASDKVILTVPSRVVRGLDKPEALMRFWDRVLDACADLATRPRARKRPERYVADTQISAGWMHAGYPIMTHLKSAEVMVSVDRIRAEGAWGLFHEMGHNHQSRDWTFSGTSEVTVNLFTLYVQDTLLGKRGQGFTPGPERDKKWAREWAAYQATGPDFAHWKKKPFLALISYVQLQEAFGWDTFQKVFADYRALRPEDRPKTDDQKRDQWLTRFSRRAGKNLGPFFQAWAIPTSEKARAEIADLPVWMPEGFPPGSSTRPSSRRSVSSR
jgi:enhancin-like peptidase M60 family/peptidase M60-like protein